MVATSTSAATMLPIRVTVTLSPRALATLRRTHEAIVADASYSGEPNAAGARRVDEIGRIDLGSERLRLSADGGEVVFTGATLQARRFAWVKPGTAEVNINVYSARLSGPDNILACDFYQDYLRLTPKIPIVLACKLIVEGGATRAISSSAAPPSRP